MMFRLLALALLGALIGSDARADDRSGDYVTGTVYHDSFPLPHYSIPLPPGEWKLAASKDGMNEERMHFVSLNLVQIVQGRGTAYLGITGNVDLPRHGHWARSEICHQKDLYRMVSVSDYETEQACWWINHRVFRPEPGFVPPPVAIEHGIFIANNVMVLTYVLGTNPELDGIHQNGFTSWADSPFHKDRLDSDPARSRYMTEQIKVTEDLFARLKALML